MYEVDRAGVGRSRRRGLRRTLAAVVISLFAALAGIVPQASAAVTYYRVEVTFETLKFYGLSERPTQAYGSIMVGAGEPGQNSFGYRNLGAWGGNASFWESPRCQYWEISHRPTDADPRCVTENDQGLLSEPPLCTSNGYKTCVNPHAAGNNKVVLKVRAGDTIRAWVYFMDDDSNGDDKVCSEGKDLDVTSVSMLASLDHNLTLWTPTNPDGSCSLRYHVKTTGPWPNQ